MVTPLSVDQVHWRGGFFWVFTLLRRSATAAVAEIKVNLALLPVQITESKRNDLDKVVSDLKLLYRLGHMFLSAWVALHREWCAKGWKELMDQIERSLIELMGSWQTAARLWIGDDTKTGLLIPLSCWQKWVTDRTSKHGSGHEKAI